MIKSVVSLALKTQLVMKIIGIRVRIHQEIQNIDVL